MAHARRASLPDRRGAGAVCLLGGFFRRESLRRTGLHAALCRPHTRPEICAFYLKKEFRRFGIGSVSAIIDIDRSTFQNPQEQLRPSAWWKGTVSSSGNSRKSLRARSPAASVFTRAYRYRRSIPAFPAQWFYGYFVLFPENGSFASVAAQMASRNLAPAQRRPNHTISPYASGAYV